VGRTGEFSRFKFSKGGTDFSFYCGNFGVRRFLDKRWMYQDFIRVHCWEINLNHKDAFIYRRDIGTLS
jgi:hypothetical protein